MLENCTPKFIESPYLVVFNSNKYDLISTLVHPGFMIYSSNKALHDEILN